MEDIPNILKILLVVAAIAIGVAKNRREEANKKKARKTFRPQAETVPHAPSPEETDETYGGYIPSAPAPEPEPMIPPTPVMPAEGIRTTPQPKAKPAPTPDTPPRTDGDGYEFRSPDDVRRAIVWSEILTRKY